MNRRRLGSYVLLAATLAGFGIGALGANPADVLRGRVLDPSGEPLAGARVELRSRAGPCFLTPGYSGQQWTTDAAGRFAVPYPNQPMDVRVDHDDFAMAWLPAENEMTVRLEMPAYVDCEIEGPATACVRRGAELLAEQGGSGVIRLGPLPPYEALTVSAVRSDARPAQEWVRLQPGEVRRVSLALDEARALTGQLSQPLADVAIRASQGDGRDCVVRTQADGSFTVRGLLEGAVRLVILVPDRPVQIVDTTAGASVHVEVAR